MKNTLLSASVFIAILCMVLASCSSGTTPAGDDSSSAAAKDTSGIQLAEPDFSDFLKCFDECSLPYPENFTDVSENEIPEALSRTYIFMNDTSIGNSSSSGILLTKGRFGLPGNKVGIIFSESNSDHTEKSTYLFIFDSDGSFISSYMLDNSYRGAETRENYTSVISTNRHILTTLITERRDLISDEWSVSEESFHYMINNDGRIVDSSYE